LRDTALSDTVKVKPFNTPGNVIFLRGKVQISRYSSCPITPQSLLTVVGTDRGADGTRPTNLDDIKCYNLCGAAQDHPS